MTTNVDLANMALIKVGHGTVVNLEGTTKAQKIIKANIERWKDFVFRMNTWNILKKRASLAADSSSPSHEYDFRYRLPSDCIKLLRVYVDRDYVREGDYILTNQSAPIYITYIYRPESENLNDSLLIDLIALKIAYEIVEPLTQSNTKKQLIKQDWEDMLKQTGSQNAQENSPQELVEDDWITERY